MKNFLITYSVILIFSFSCRHSQEPVQVQKSESLVKEIFITCDIRKLNSIYKNWNVDTYIPVTIVADGTLNSNARLRIRGDSSREFPKKSLKIKLDDGPMIFGRRVLNLNAEYEDPSYIHQYLASYIFQQAGHPCFNAEHVRIYINGEFFGLYLMIENIDAEFLVKRNLDEHANLYKATKDGASLGYFDDVNFHWEKKTNIYSGRQDLQDLINTLDTISDGHFYDFIEQNFDYEKLINIISINTLIANSSTYYHNYYMFHDINNSNKWTMFPWDMDKTFSRYGNVYYNYSSSFWQHDNPLLERSVSNPIMLNDIKNRINELGEILFNPSILDSKIDSLKHLLSSSVKQDSTDRIIHYSDWEEQLEKEKNYIKNKVAWTNYQINYIPNNFRIIRTPEQISADYIFRWYSSRDPNGDEITYSFICGPDADLDHGDDRIIIENLRDTYLTCPINLEDGKHYWKVIATDGKNPVDGWDNLNYFNFKKGTILPQKIASVMELTAEGSPYYIKEETSVTKEGELTIREGSEIRFNRGVNLFVYGKINALGTRQQPILLKPNTGEDYWGYIYIINPTDKCEFKYTHFEEGHIYSKKLELLIENSSFIINKKDMVVDQQRLGVIWLYIGKFEMRNSIIRSNGTGEGLNINKATAIVENCIIDNAPDAIEYIEVHDGIIRNNIVTNSPDDAVDFNGCKNVIIEQNVFKNNKDKGISVGHEGNGPSTGITIRYNQIINCGIGISVKDSSEALILNNTIYGCGIGIKCYHKKETNVGGNAIAINNIIAASESEPIEVDAKSKLEVSYTLCDSKKLIGEGNIKDKPGFFNVAKDDFHLGLNSSAAGISHPNYSEEFIGALPVKQIMIAINEISLKSGNKGGEWIELSNQGEQDINISGWVLHDLRSTDKYIFPVNTIIEKKSILVVVANSDKFREDYKKRINYIGNIPFKINALQNRICLVTDLGEQVDCVAFDFSEKERKRIKYFNINQKSNWNSFINIGSPGRKNSPIYLFFYFLSFSVLAIVGVVWIIKKRHK